jgi:hypothetical protein
MIQFRVNLTGDSVSSVTVLNGGSGLTSPLLIVIDPPSTPTGTQATATAVVSGGSVTSVTVTDGGSGYSETPTAYAVNQTVEALDVRPTDLSGVQSQINELDDLVQTLGQQLTVASGSIPRPSGTVDGAVQVRDALLPEQFLAYDTLYFNRQTSTLHTPSLHASANIRCAGQLTCEDTATIKTLNVSGITLTGQSGVPQPVDPTSGLPTGGTQGQVLTKTGTTNYLSQWQSLTTAILNSVTGGSVGQLLAISSSNTLGWVSGVIQELYNLTDTTGQVLIKTAEGVGWSTVASSGSSSGPSGYAFFAMNSSRFGNSSTSSQVANPFSHHVVLEMDTQVFNTTGGNVYRSGGSVFLKPGGVYSVTGHVEWSNWSNGYRLAYLSIQQYGGVNTLRAAIATSNHAGLGAF